MGKIKIEGMEFYAFHGHFKEEQVVGNRFLVDLSIDTDMTIASATDDLEDAVDYQQVYAIIKREMDIKSALLENVASRIITSIKNEMNGVQSVTIKISKMNPNLGGKITSVSVILSI